MKAVFAPSYVWTVVGSLIACSVMKIVGMLPEGYFLHIYLLSILMSLVMANSRFLLGKDHIKGFNITYMLQGGMRRWMPGFSPTPSAIWGRCATIFPPSASTASTRCSATSAPMPKTSPPRPAAPWPSACSTTCGPAWGRNGGPYPPAGRRAGWRWPRPDPRRPGTGCRWR